MSNPQTNDVSNPQPKWAVNAKWVNGVAPGYWPTAGAGLTLNLSAGSANNAGTIVNYAGGTLALANNTTNFVYLDPAASYAPSSNTTGFTASVVPIATVVTASGAITSITDNRLAASAGGSPGGTNHQTQINSSGVFAGVATGTAGQYLRSGGASADPAFASIAESEVTGLTSDLGGKVPTSRQISTTAPLTGGGDLSADRTLAISNFTGDSGSGGAKGAVPAPAAGDAAAGKFLKADGTWAVPSVATSPLVLGFVINNGAVGNNVAAMLVVPRVGTVSKCVIVTKASDGTTGLTVRIKQNGIDVFTSDPTVASGTASGTVSSSTALTSNPLSVAAGDVFQIDILSGTPNWAFTAQLET